MARHSLTLPVRQHTSPYGIRLQAALPADAAGQWCHLRLGLPAAGAAMASALPQPQALWWAKLELADAQRGQVVREFFLGPCRTRSNAQRRAEHGRMLWRQTLVHVPRDSNALAIDIFGNIPAGDALPPPAPVLEFRVLSRAMAAWRLLAQGRRGLPAALSGSPLGALGRVRAVLGQAPARAGEAPPYSVWVAMFEPPLPAAPPPDGTDPGIRIAVVAGEPAPTQASLAAAALAHAGPTLLIRDRADWQAISAPWVILLQAGEVLRPGAAAAFAAAIATCPWADIITADCDRLTAAGERVDPLFKPGPDPLLLPTGLPVRGACAIRWQNVPLSLPLHGGAARLLLAVRAPGRIAHIPAILSHVRADHAPHGANAGVHPAPHATPPPPPVTVQGALPSVTIIVPTAARARHVVRCIGAVARQTAMPGLAINVVLSDPERAAPAVLRRLRALPAVSVLPAETHPFNYPAVNNLAAAQVSSEFMLLMNDDVAPLPPGRQIARHAPGAPDAHTGTEWLTAMVAHMRDPAVGIVGARLLYGNGMVQHEGVIMGLANLCEHAGRLRDGATAGPHGIGMLDRQVSAVTAACLLIRTSLYRDLGGMDALYAIALNDVDLCLRAREAGWRVVYCAHATLHHYESLSLGRHYAGARAGLEGLEVRRLRARFAAAIDADPCYNPLASLQPGREWQPAFPPRPNAQIRGAPRQPPNPAAYI